MLLQKKYQINQKVRIYLFRYIGFGFIVFKDELSVVRCLRDKNNHIMQGKQIERKIANLKPSINNTINTNVNHIKYDLIGDTSFLLTEKDRNVNDKKEFYSTNFLLPNLSEQNQKELYFNSQSEKRSNSYLSKNIWKHNSYVNPTTIDSINKTKRNTKLKYNFRHLEDGKYNSYDKEKKENDLTNLFLYQQESEHTKENECINSTQNVHNSSSFVKELHHQNLFEDYFNNHIKDPKLNFHNKFQLLDINGEDASTLSAYQNTTKVKLFNSETSNNTSDKESNNSSISNYHSSNNLHSSSSHNNSINSSSKGNITLNSIISYSNSSNLSDSVVIFDSDYKDSDEEQKPNNSNAYYGPRIHETTKLFPFSHSFQPY